MKSTSDTSPRTTIVLVRHGRSTHDHDGRWLRPHEVGSFEAAYNAAGIRDDSLPPAELIAASGRADIVVASDMIRAIDSARRLRPGREPEICPLLREITLDPPLWLRVPLPILLWDVACHTMVSYRIWRDTDHEQVQRAREAAAWLVQRATTGRTIVAVTHGGFRRLLDAQLRRRGWERTPGVRSYENWSTWTYVSA